MELLVIRHLAEPPSWKFEEIRVKDFINPSANMKVIFQVGDNDPNGTDVIEAGVDYFRAWDADPISSTGEAFNESLKLSASPNPSQGDFIIAYELDEAPIGAKLMVYNALGQAILERSLDARMGRLNLADLEESGVYLAKIVNDGKSSRAIRLVKQ